MPYQDSVPITAGADDSGAPSKASAWFPTRPLLTERYVDNGSSRIFSPSIAFRHDRSDCVSAGLGVEYARRSTTYIGDTRNESSIISVCRKLANCLARKFEKTRTLPPKNIYFSIISPQTPIVL